MFNKQAFGSAPSTSTFGGFGTTQTSAGVTPFGQNSFNKPAGAAAGFQSTGFGGTGGTSLFGGTTSTQSTGLFGNTSTPAFSQQQPQQQQQTTVFSGFNNNGSAPLFGNTVSAGFAQPNKPAFGGFNTSTQSTSLFGAQPSATTAISGTSLFSGQSTGLFGSPSAGFGNAVANTNQIVGTPIKFNPLSGTDTMVKNNQTTTISTRHQCITCMKEYENKSLEELRLEDLQAGRKGPQQGAGMFGATGQPAQTSLFGSTLGQQATSGFGENKLIFGSTPTSTTGLGGFGATTPAFGTAAQNTGGLFGKPTGFGAAAPVSSAPTGFSFSNTNNTMFGGGGVAAAATPQKTFGGGGMFGAQQPSSMFGNPATTNTGFGGFGAQQQPQQQPQQQGIGLFGQAKPTTSPFGLPTSQPTAQSTFGFNQNTATSQPSLFGNKPTLGTGLNTGFGTTATSSFGAKPLGTAAPAFGASSFGMQQPAASLGGGTSLFGQNTMNKPAGTVPNSFGFGAQQPMANFGTALSGGSTLFGNKTAAPTNLFGANTSTNMFNNNAATGTTNLFGNTNPFGTSGGGLTLGQNTTLNLSNNKPFGGFGTTLGTQPSIGTSQSPSSHQNIMNLVSYPYGDQPLFRNLPKERMDELRMKATNPAAQKAAIAQSSPSFSISSAASPRLTVRPPSAAPAKASLFEGLDMGSQNSPSSSLFKNLAAAITPKNSIKLLKLRPDLNSSGNSSISAAQTPEKPLQPPSAASTPTWAASSKFRDILPGNNSTSTPKTAGKPEDRELEVCDDLDGSLSDVRSVRKLMLEESQGPLNTTNASIALSDITNVYEDDAEVETPAPHPAGIVMHRSGYYTLPSLDELAKLFEETNRCEVANFTIGRANYGNIYFNEPMDVAGLNLDEIVHIRHREVVVYPNDDAKPPLGQGLNRKAQVTLDRIYPTNKQTRAPIKDVDTIINMDYDTTLRKACYKMEARFIDYIPESGSWIFKVDHFSKYGLPDDSDDDDDITVANVTKPRAAVQVPAKTPVMVQAHLPPAVPLKPHTLSNTRTSFNQSITLPALDSMEEDYQAILSPNEQLLHLTRMNASKVRVMKASLFEMEVADDEDEVIEDEYMFENPMTPPHTQELSVIRNLKSDMTLAVPENETRPSKPYQKPKIFAPTCMPFPTLMPKALDTYLADAGLFKGHCSKTSWTVNGALVATKDQLVSLTCPFVASDSQTEMIEKHMTIQLNLTCSDSEDGVVPRLSPREGQDLLEAHCELVKSMAVLGAKQRMARQVLLLCHALWAELPALSSESTPALISNARRNAFCDWLQKVICEEDQANDQPAASREHKYLQQMFQGKLVDCVQECQEAGDHYLSFILASAGSSSATKSMCQQQLMDWVSVGMSGFIQEERLKAMVVCGAGQAMLSQEDGATLNSLQNLSWLSALAAHAWYICSPASSLPDIVGQYDASFQQQHLAAAPVPPLGSEECLDLRYQLLKLFTQRTFPLEQLLTPETHYPESPLDFSLSWLLLMLLESLHYTHASEHCSQNLHLLFAEQLESVGQWHWAIFVLLHIVNPTMRASVVEQTILRHVQPNWDGLTKSLNEKEEFVISKLGVPAKLIFSAKAMHMKNTNRFLELAQYYFYAEEWDMCFETLITNLVADSIINENYKLVWELLQQLQHHSHEIGNWHLQGQVYFGYLQLREELERLNVHSAEDKLEAIMQKVVSVCTQLRNMPCSTPKERLCQSEMAYKLMDMARELILANCNTNRAIAEDQRLRELENAMRFVYRNNDVPQPCNI